jgi:hypothetical protein
MAPSAAHKEGPRKMTYDHKRMSFEERVLEDAKLMMTIYKHVQVQRHEQTFQSLRILEDIEQEDLR